MINELANVTRSQGALRALGYFLHHVSLAPLFNPERTHNIITEVASIISTCSNKATANLCVWLLGVQNLPRGIVLVEAKRLLEIILTASVNPFNSASIEHETLAVWTALASNLCSSILSDRAKACYSAF